MLSPMLEQLMIVFDFTEDDLLANRQGHFADAQRDQLRSWQLQTRFMGLAQIVGIVVVLVVMGNMVTSVPPDTSSVLSLLVMALSGGVGILVIIRFLIKQRRYGTLLTARGPLHVTAADDDRYTLTVEDFTIPIDDDQYDTVIDFALEDQLVTVYYVRMGRWPVILSMDPDAT